MIVEILGAKMLAPYVGMSHFVWTAQIAITLVALATGYYAGGWLVDRSPRLGNMYWAIIAAAVYLGAAILVVEPVAYWCLNFKLAQGSLMASGFLFFLPLSLLAMVGPFFIRMLTSTVQDVGRNIGRLTAISTLGSFAGTLLIGYVFIRLPNSKTMFLTSCALMAVAAGYFIGWGRANAVKALAVLAVLAGLAIGGTGVARDRLLNLPNVKEVHRANSNFGRLQVLSIRNDALRYYMNDFLVQNDYDPNTHKSVGAFTYMLHDLARAYNPAVSNVLCIGMGVGVVPMDFANDGAKVDVVEINPAVVPIAEKFFDFVPAKVHLTIDDGRHFLNETANHYDAIILDAFLGDSSPSHLLSREAFSQMRRAMSTNGVLVINCFGYLEPGKDFFASSVDQTLRSVFRSVKIHGTGLGNMFFVASDQPQLNAGQFPDISQVPEECRSEVETARNSDWKANAADGILLTDDYNPLEYYDAANREEIRHRLAMSMKTP